MMPSLTSGPQSHTAAATHTNSRALHTRTRTRAGTHARAQAGTHTHTSTHAYSEPLRAAFGSAGARGKGYTPTVFKTSHDTPMTGACSPSFGAVGVHPSLGRSLALPFCSLEDQSTSWNPSFSMWAPFNKKRNQSDLPLCLVNMVHTDTEVGPLGEEVFIIRFIHHLLLPGINGVGEHLCLWEKCAV